METPKINLLNMLYLRKIKYENIPAIKNLTKYRRGIEKFLTIIIDFDEGTKI